NPADRQSTPRQQNNNAAAGERTSPTAQRNRDAAGSSAAQQSSRPGWHSFGGPEGGSQAGAAGDRGSVQQAPSRQGGRFGQSQRETAPAQAPRSQEAPINSRGGGWQRFEPSSSQPRGSQTDVSGSTRSSGRSDVQE